MVQVTHHCLPTSVRAQRNHSVVLDPAGMTKVSIKRLGAIETRLGAIEQQLVEGPHRNGQLIREAVQELKPSVAML
jgi:hypothetical protein